VRPQISQRLGQAAVLTDRLGTTTVAHVPYAQP
jgi:hypothetical protein